MKRTIQVTCLFVLCFLMYLLLFKFSVIWNAINPIQAEKAPIHPILVPFMISLSFVLFVDFVLVLFSVVFQGLISGILWNREIAYNSFENIGEIFLGEHGVLSSALLASLLMLPIASWKVLFSKPSPMKIILCKMYNSYPVIREIWQINNSLFNGYKLAAPDSIPIKNYYSVQWLLAVIIIFLILIPLTPWALKEDWQEIKVKSERHKRTRAETAEITNTAAPEIATKAIEWIVLKGSFIAELLGIVAKRFLFFIFNWKK
ncbi:MAG: hypothetical protein V1698_00035 [bacterium]